MQMVKLSVACIEKLMYCKIFTDRRNIFLSDQLWSDQVHYKVLNITHLKLKFIKSGHEQ